MLFTISSLPLSLPFLPFHVLYLLFLIFLLSHPLYFSLCYTYSNYLMRPCTIVLPDENWMAISAMHSDQDLDHISIDIGVNTIT